MDLGELAKQFSGRRFGELVLLQYKSLSLEGTIAALQGTIQEMPSCAHPLVESWIDKIAPKGAQAAFWKSDCGETFLEICKQARFELKAVCTEFNDDHVFCMFQIILINFAYSLHKNASSKSFVQKSLGIGFLRRLLS